jgi:hypothetical protein
MPDQAVATAREQLIPEKFQCEAQINDSLFRCFQVQSFSSPPGPWHLSVMRTPVALPPFTNGKVRAMTTRRRSKQTQSLGDRLASFAKEVRDEAASLPPGSERDELLRKARQADTAVHLDDWANSPGLQPPK